LTDNSLTCSVGVNGGINDLTSSIKIFTSIEDCVTLYEYCFFEGNSKTYCDSMSWIGDYNYFYSVHLGSNVKSVKLYERKNYEGMEFFSHTSEGCFFDDFYSGT